MSPTHGRVRFVPALLMSVGAFLAGCSDSPKGKVTEVEGAVTLDGSPLVKVYVQFLPEATGMPGSTAVTDESGHYTLRTSDNRPGAVVGKHRVTIRGERADERSGTKGSPRQVPAKYTTAGADNPLGAIEVSEAKKTGYDFDLKSK